MFRYTYRIVPIVGHSIEVIVHAEDRKTAFRKLESALGGPPREAIGMPVEVRLNSVVEVREAGRGDA